MSSSRRKLFIATPCYDASVAAAHAGSIYAIVKDPDVHIDQVWQYQADVVRVRSRVVRRFLESDATHLLFIDSDISFEPDVVRGLLASGYDVVGAPYPFKKIMWDRVVGATAERLEASAYDYPMHISRNSILDDRACFEVDAVPMGMTVLSRACLTTMAEHYAPTLSFLDQDRATVALFHLMIRDGALLSEDYSFCQRWRDIGGTVKLYCGPGAPVTHHGWYAYRGSRDGLLGL